MTSRRLAVAAASGVLAVMSLAACAPTGSEPYASPAGDQPALVNATGDVSAAPPAAAATTPPPAAAPADLTTQLIAKAVDKMGKVVTNEDGFILYRFDKDTANPPKSNCNGDCAKLWPPALTDGNPELVGLDATKIGTVVRDDGTRQLTIGNWPVYLYAGDTKPGTWKGQGVGGTWFVVAPDGKKNLSCLPTSTPTPVPVPGDKDAGGDSSGGSTTY